MPLPSEAPRVSDESPPVDPDATVADSPDAGGPDAVDRRDPDASGRQAFVRALRVRRNAKWGLAAGVAFAALVFAFFVAVPGTYRSPLWYVALAFVLALSTAGLVAFLLTLGRAYRLSREL